MKQTYRGSCHCGRVSFEIDADIDHARVCDCTVCRKRGALNFRIHEDDFRPLTPLNEMTLYQWHTKTAKDYFCPHCGILPFRQPRTGDSSIWTINLRCLEGVDLDTLPIEHVYGSRLK
ncbi:MAG: GFA family protein [Gammaproteobacteria bacterium]|jgi:hypothetical protein|nr:GFA family protein [Gammaproteobacteria bacterium]MBT4493828.1 GFA family protein [Gammaproteobacteria bacterium]MBT7369900.1 GFA family protein [Gammaproteobacteria bacterium]